ncbi:hypothetical protein [Cohnella nanjingensis]|uniref:Uncharacterized protein n=1 Tax=Cohnella nanjingensis TaxID=1387779 RepID=A0A7X0RTZ3_9BACL|nr:hypothetical protein [Cohnella nanjingensis]MBB6673550.1 hypothetical protein [Cohnella nanjingensis]
MDAAYMVKDDTAIGEGAAVLGMVFTKWSGHDRIQSANVQTGILFCASFGSPDE